MFEKKNKINKKLGKQNDQKKGIKFLGHLCLFNPPEQSLASACQKNRSGQEILLLPWKYGFFL